MKKEDWQERGKGHRERLRQRFVTGGLEKFTDEEVVEFLLTLGTPRGDLKIAARDAMKTFGTLSSVLSAPMEKLLAIKGIGEKNALYLGLVHQTAKRYLRDRIAGKTFFGSSQAVFDYLFHSMRDLKREVFKVFFLTRKNEVITDCDMFEGSLTGSAVYPREIVTHALEHKAAGLVFVHNHPSGDPAPSPEDQRLTRDLVWAAMLMGIQVLDHLIIGNNRYFSFADQGIIKRFADEYHHRFDTPLNP